MIKKGFKGRRYVGGGAITPKLDTPDIAILSVTDNSISMSFTRPANTLGYVLLRATNAGFTANVTTVYSGNSNSFTDTGLSASTIYYYKVKGVNPPGFLDSNYSVIQNATTGSASDPEAVLKSIFDFTYFVKDAKNVSGVGAGNGEFIGTIPSSKGSANLVASLTTTPQTQIGKYRTAGGGYLDLDNEPNYYWANTSDLNTLFPCEFHFTGLLLSVFPSEAYFNIFGLYLGDVNGNSIRTVNRDPSVDPTAGWTGVHLPVGKPFQCRIVYNGNKTATVWINGVSLGGSKSTFFLEGGNNVKRLGFGTNTNNAKWFASSAAFINRLLTTQEATDAYNAFKTKYKTEVDFAYPVLRNVAISQAGNVVTVSSTFFSPTGVGVGTLTYVYYGAGNNANPDVTNNHPVALPNAASFNKVTYASIISVDSWIRVDIFCTDANGLTSGMACGVQYFHVT